MTNNMSSNTWPPHLKRNILLSGVLYLKITVLLTEKKREGTSMTLFVAGQSPSLSLSSFPFISPLLAIIKEPPKTVKIYIYNFLSGLSVSSGQL